MKFFTKLTFFVLILSLALSGAQTVSFIDFLRALLGLPPRVTSTIPTTTTTTTTQVTTTESPLQVLLRRLGQTGSTTTTLSSSTSTTAPPTTTTTGVKTARDLLQEIWWRLFPTTTTAVRTTTESPINLECQGLANTLYTLDFMIDTTSSILDSIQSGLRDNALPSLATAQTNFNAAPTQEVRDIWGQYLNSITAEINFYQNLSARLIQVQADLRIQKNQVEGQFAVNCPGFNSNLRILSFGSVPSYNAWQSALADGLLRIPVSLAVNTAAKAEYTLKSQNPLASAEAREAYNGVLDTIAAHEGGANAASNQMTDFLKGLGIPGLS